MELSATLSTFWKSADAYLLDYLTPSSVTIRKRLVKIRLGYLQPVALQFHISVQTFRTKLWELQHAGEYLGTNRLSDICISWKTVLT